MSYTVHASASSIEWVVKSTADAPALRKQREFTALQSDRQLTTQRKGNEIRYGQYSHLPVMEKKM